MTTVVADGSVVVEGARVKALYLQGYFANPSGLSRTEPEKNALATLLGDAGLVIPVIEPRER